MFVRLKTSDAIIGRNVNARKPMSHGDRKISPQRASFRPRADRPSDGRPGSGGVAAGTAGQVTGRDRDRRPRLLLRLRLRPPGGGRRVAVVIRTRPGRSDRGSARLVPDGLHLASGATGTPCPCRGPAVLPHFVRYLPPDPTRPRRLVVGRHEVLEVRLVGVLDAVDGDLPVDRVGELRPGGRRSRLPDRPSGRGSRRRRCRSSARGVAEEVGQERERLVGVLGRLEDPERVGVERRGRWSRCRTGWPPGPSRRRRRRRRRSTRGSSRSSPILPVKNG